MFNTVGETCIPEATTAEENNAEFESKAVSLQVSDGAVCPSDIF